MSNAWGDGVLQINQSLPASQSQQPAPENILRQCMRAGIFQQSMQLPHKPYAAYAAFTEVSMHNLLPQLLAGIQAAHAQDQGNSARAW